MKALIIEDEPGMATVLRSYLEGIGFSVTVTASMAVAVQIITETPELEVITLDLNLNDSRAAETLPRIAEIRKNSPNALLVVVSGVLTHEDKGKAIEYGADATFEKLDVPTERSFIQRLRDVAVGLVRTPTKYASRINLLQALASKVAARYNELGLGLGGVPSEDEPKETGHA